MTHELAILMGAMGLVLAVALVQVLVLVRLTRTASNLTRVHDRLTRLTVALDLLTETTEAGFGHIAAQVDARIAVGRAGAALVPATRKASRSTQGRRAPVTRELPQEVN
jgi:hypothetical protein